MKSVFFYSVPLIILKVIVFCPFGYIKTSKNLNQLMSAKNGKIISSLLLIYQYTGLKVYFNHIFRRMKWKKENNLPKLTGPNGDDIKSEEERSESPDTAVDKDSVTSSSPPSQPSMTSM